MARIPQFVMGLRSSVYAECVKCSGQIFSCVRTQSIILNVICIVQPAHFARFKRREHDVASQG